MFHFIFLLVGSNVAKMPNVSFLEGVILTILVGCGGYVVGGKKMKIKAKLSSISIEISSWS